MQTAVAGGGLRGLGIRDECEKIRYVAVVKLIRDRQLSLRYACFEAGFRL